MTLSTAVIIATKGRPQEVSNLLDTLALQTVPPDWIVVSACDNSDVDASRVLENNVQVIFGSPGLTAQRNRALSLVGGKCDVLVFFDDDFIPSRFWIERIQMLLATQSDVGCVTGRVLTDGVKFGGLEWSVGNSIVNDSDSLTQSVAKVNQIIKDHVSPYGCNMAFRATTIAHLWFDERLALYGWMEDRDFGFRVATRAKVTSTDIVWGVHLGSQRGRVSGLKFGYSQVVNPWYLRQKGVLTLFDFLKSVVFGLAANSLGAILTDSYIDRWGRLKGNIIGIKDILLNRWAPERVTEF
jgi:glycosyltransferase involved in cell wall biosynthesis